MRTFGQRTFLLGDYRIAAAVKGRGKYGHTFGGPHDRKGTSRKDCRGILIHLLHRFDLADPAIPVSIPGIRWLPLYYCFDFRANDLGYRLVSDGALVTYFPKNDPNVSTSEEWPHDDYPTEFPQSSIKIAREDYDPTDLEDAYFWAGVFGIDKLSKRDHAAARKRAAKLATGLGFAAPKTEEEYAEALSGPFTQGKPNAACLNPKCAGSKQGGSLVPFALMSPEPLPGIRPYGDAGVQLLFQICPRCSTIRASNQGS